MERFWRYLENEPEKITRIITYFLFWFFIAFFYSYVIVDKFMFSEQQLVGFKLIHWKGALIFFYAALLEEAAFRFAPFSLVHEWAAEYKKYLKPAILAVLIFFSFMLFGFVHKYRLANIFNQGVLGLNLGMVYLKLGGIRNKVVKPLAACTLFHWLYNILTASTIYIKISG